MRPFGNLADSGRSLAQGTITVLRQVGYFHSLAFRALASAPFLTRTEKGRPLQGTLIFLEMRRRRTLLSIAVLLRRLSVARTAYGKGCETGKGQSRSKVSGRR